MNGLSIASQARAHLYLCGHESRLLSRGVSTQSRSETVSETMVGIRLPTKGKTL